MYCATAGARIVYSANAINTHIARRMASRSIRQTAMRYRQRRCWGTKRSPSLGRGGADLRLLSLVYGLTSSSPRHVQPLQLSRGLAD